MTPVSIHPLYRDDDPSRLREFAVDAPLVRRLRESYTLLRTRGDRLAVVFYDNLFQAHPGLRTMFRTDPVVQRAKFMASLDSVARFLDQPLAQREYLTGLGAMHAGLGVRPAHYDIVIDILAASMGEVLDELSAESATATDEWRLALRLISDQMIGGASR